MGKGNHWFNCRDQLCYKCQSLEIDNNTVLHVVCSNFKVETYSTSPVVSPAAHNVTDQSLLVDDDVTSNVCRQEIAYLHQQGIEVDEDNEPAPENVMPPPQATTAVGEWIPPLSAQEEKPIPATASVLGEVCMESH
ncbi:hypothetical protein ACHAW6_010478 [Cyclotella cf. meneghiniana]